MANRSRPDFGDVRVSKKTARWGGRRVPISKKANNWLAMLWNFKGNDESMHDPLNADDPRRIDNLRGFWFSHPNIDDDDHENERWYISKPLGDGGFGQVALWVRQDQETGHAGTAPADFCAVKQFKYQKSDQYENLAAGVMTEGVYQCQLNLLPKSMNVLFLRRYKTYFMTEVARTGRSGVASVTFAPELVRAYLDYAPYGDLQELTWKYSAFDKHLPEAFLWHVFYSLARAVQLMNAGPWTRLKLVRSTLKEVKLTDEVFLNHFDMKSANIFLGFNAADQAGRSATDANEWRPEFAYPQVLLADFGLADLLTEDNKMQDHKEEASYTDRLIHQTNPGFPNPESHWANEAAAVYGPRPSPNNPWNGNGWGRGTPAQWPPEQLRLGAHWENPPNGRLVRSDEAADIGEDGRPTYDAAQEVVYDDKDAKGYRFKPASNVWSLGKIMHDLAYLTASSQYLNEFRQLPQTANEQQQRYDEVGGNMLDPWNTDSEYSQDLHDLIRSCMNISQEKRPTADAIVTATQARLESWTRNAQAMSAQEREQLRLFYRGHEINQMSPGPNDFDKPQALFDMLIKNKYTDPALEQLNLPDKGWKEMKRKYASEQDLGLWKMPQFQMGADGVAYFVPPQLGAVPQTEKSTDRPEATPQIPACSHGNILDIGDPRLKIYRTNLEAEVNASLRQINALGHGTEKGFTLARLAERTSLGDKDIIATLLILYSLPPKATLEWISARAETANDSSVLFAHDPSLPQNLRAIDRKLNTRVRNSMLFILHEQNFTRVRLLEALAEYTRRCIENNDIPTGDAEARVSRFNILKELFLRYTQTLGDGHQLLSSVNQLTNYVGRLPTNIPFADDAGDNEAQENTEASREKGGNDAGTEGIHDDGNDGDGDDGHGDDGEDDGDDDGNNDGAKKAGQAGVAAITPAPQPAIPQPGDARGQAADGTPRYYCKHDCRTGLRSTGIRCAHNCCQNGAKTKPK